MKRLERNVRHGINLSEQYAGKGTAMTAFAMISKALNMNGLLAGEDGADESCLQCGIAIECKRVAKEVACRRNLKPTGQPTDQQFGIQFCEHAR